MKKVIYFFIGIAVIFGVLHLSKCILAFFKIPFPASILGIIIFFILLKTKIIKEIWIKDFCEFITKYMILFFIPMFVGMMTYFDIISKNLVAIIATIFISTTCVVILTGLFTYNIIKFTRLSRLKKGQNK